MFSLSKFYNYENNEGSKEWNSYPPLYILNDGKICNFLGKRGLFILILNVRIKNEEIRGNERQIEIIDLLDLI